MRYFERNGKYNFIDNNNSFVGFDAASCCCEDFGWALTELEPDGTEAPYNVKFGQLEADSLQGFLFDRPYLKRNLHPSYGDGGSLTFRLVSYPNEAFLTIWNHHNGWYSHGFEFGHPGGVVVGDL